MTITQLIHQLVYKSLLIFLLLGCYTPDRGGLYEFRYVKLVEINKTEMGFELLWKDNIRTYRQFVKDTSGSNCETGITILTLLPK